MFLGNKLLCLGNSDGLHMSGMSNLSLVGFIGGMNFGYSDFLGSGFCEGSSMNDFDSMSSSYFERFLSSGNGSGL
jgi:hypothetical protein